MKRTLFIVVAALVVLLSYPSTHPWAGTTSQALNDGRNHPAVVLPPGNPGGGIGTNDADGGDADGLAGIKGGRHGSGPTGVDRLDTRTLLRVWWNFLVFIRV